MQGRRGRGRWAQGLWRVIVGAVAAAVGLLAVVPAPTSFLWTLEVAITEWGHWFALAALLPLLPGWRRSRLGQAGAGLGLLGAALALSSLVRAAGIMGQVPGALDAAFGAVPPRT